VARADDDALVEFLTKSYTVGVQAEQRVAWHLWMITRLLNFLQNIGCKLCKQLCSRPNTTTDKVDNAFIVV
jgi:hypothetical protein